MPIARAARWSICLGLAVAAAAAPGLAVTYRVTKTADTADGTCTESDCSLREAVIAANGNPGPDVVNVPSGTYALTLTAGGDEQRGDLDVLDSVTIRTQPRDTDPAVIETDLSERLLTVGAAGASVTLRRLVLRGGGPEIFGGGILVVDGGVLALEQSEVSDSEAAQGGGIFLELTAQGTLVDSVVTGNVATEHGGGVYAPASGALTLIDSAVLGNDAGTDGGGLMARGTVTILRSLVSGNSAADDGGGLYVGGGTTTVIECTISDNDASKWGGGFAVTSTLIVRRSMVGANHAQFGGGIYSFAVGLEVESSTFTVNTATSHGGGIYIATEAPQLRVSSSTLAINVANSDSSGFGLGGGIYALAGIDLTLHNTILANNLADASPSDCWGTIDSLGYNLIEATSGCFIAGITDGNVLGVDPALGALTSNSGPTLNFMPLASSPAVDAGDPAGCVGADGILLATDQRGFPRHTDDDSDGEARCDIGAVERSLFSDGFESGDASRWSAAAG